MSLTILQMFGGGTGGTQDAVANIDIPEDGNLVGVQWSIDMDFDAESESLRAELSFIATGQLTTNDARGVISAVRGQLSFTTSGAMLAAINQAHALPNLQVSGGERLFINLVSASGVTSNINCLIYHETRRQVTRRSRRR